VEKRLCNNNNIDIDNNFVTDDRNSMLEDPSNKMDHNKKNLRPTPSGQTNNASSDQRPAIKQGDISNLGFVMSFTFCAGQSFQLR
jgi:hypothetical protein